MNLSELNKVAEAMVAPGPRHPGRRRIHRHHQEALRRPRRRIRPPTRGATIARCCSAPKRRCRNIFPASSSTTRRIRQNAKDGTPLVKLIAQAGALPGIKVDKGTKPLPNCPGEVVTEGLDGLRERLAEYRGLGAHFAKWRAVIDIGSRHSELRLHQRQCACAGALCGAVPGRRHRADRRAGSADGRRPRHRPLLQITEWMLKTVFQELYYARVALEGMVLKPNMVVPGKKSAKRASVEEVAEKTAARAQGLRAGRRARHRFPVRRPVRRRSHRASRRHEQAWATCPGASPSPTAARCSRAAEDLGGQIGKRRRGAARLQPPRQMNGLATRGEWKADLERKAA